MLDNGIITLENYSDTEAIEIEPLLSKYKEWYSSDRPLWRLIEDLQRQAMVYANIIEQLKSGRTAEEIRARFEKMELVPVDKLPNPHEDQLLTKAFNKVSQYRMALVEIVRQYGRQLMTELSFEVGLTVTVGVNVGFPPSVLIAVEASTDANATRQVAGAKADAER